MTERPRPELDLSSLEHKPRCPGGGITRRDESGRDERTGAPRRWSVWSLPSGAPQSVHTHPTTPNAPTGETHSAPTTPIYAGQPQSVQSVQSGECRPTAQVGAPTGDRPLPFPVSAASCAACGEPLAAVHIADGFTTHPGCDLMRSTPA